MGVMGRDLSIHLHVNNTQTHKTGQRDCPAALLSHCFSLSISSFLPLAFVLQVIRLTG